MKNLVLVIVFVCGSWLQGFSQDTVTSGTLTVWIEQGWIIKAENTGSVPVTFRFSWTTEGTNSTGEVVSTTTEETQNIVLNNGEMRQFFTAPQDPNKEIRYIFKNILITYIKERTMQDEIDDKMKARQNSGQ